MQFGEIARVMSRFVFQRGPRVSGKRVWQECLLKCPRRWPCRSVSEEFPTVSFKSFPQVSRKRVSKELSTTWSNKSILQKCLLKVPAKTVLQRRPTRVAWRSVFRECFKEFLERVSHGNGLEATTLSSNLLCTCAFGIVVSITSCWLDPQLFLVKSPIFLLKSPFLMVEPKFRWLNHHV